MAKTPEEILAELAETKDELKLEKRFGSERNISDGKYARKVTEIALFAIITIFALAALYFVFLKVGLPTASPVQIPSL